MDPQQIKTLIDAMASSDLAEMEFSQDGWTLRLVRRSATSPSPASSRAPVVGAARGAADSTRAVDAPVAAATSTELLAPLYGVVHLRPTPDEPPFVVAGQTVKAGQTLCVIEAMKVFNEVRAEYDATVAAVLVTSGQEVEAGQALMRFA
jgi:acetyl-CoA carboxylase biotin carboxyl carrier protein